MRARIWGCRGSIATPGPNTLRYGGNTSCVEVELPDGTSAILDAGTGIRELGQSGRFAAGQPIRIFLTHLHLDHVEGLGFFGPLHDPDAEIHIWGPDAEQTLELRLRRLLSEPIFPVAIEDVAATVVVHAPPQEPLSIGGATISAALVHHVGSTLGFRVEGPGGSVAYLPDHEPAHGASDAALDAALELSDRVSVLIHDSQYAEDEYERHVGWGHSSIRHAVRFAEQAGAGRVLLSHHDPSRTDDRMDEHLARGVALARAVEVAAAVEGAEIDLRASGAAVESGRPGS